MKVISKGERVDQLFSTDTTPSKWSIGAVLTFGLKPNLHIYHSYESFIPALYLYKERQIFKDFYIPSDFLNASHVQTVLRGFDDLYGITLNVLEPTAEVCVDNFVLVTASRLLQESLGTFYRGCLLEACHLSQRVAAKAPVLFYRRSPELYGNVRFISNYIDLKDALHEEHIRSEHWKMGGGDDFCAQVSEAYHADVKVVVTVHGTHIVPLIMLPPKTVVIEILPRTLHAAMFCSALQSVDVRIVSMAQTNNGRLEPHYWCDQKDFFSYEGGGVLKLETHQDVLSEIIFLSNEEIASIVEIVKKAIND